MTPFDKFRSLSLSLSSLLFSTVDIRGGPQDKLNHASTTCASTTRYTHPCLAAVVAVRCACNGHRGKINCCPRAFNHGLHLFISTFLPLPETKSSRGLPSLFFPLLSPRSRTPNLMKNHPPLTPKKTLPFATSVYRINGYFFNYSIEIRRFSSSKSHFQEGR